jgi:hypothetical protein
MLAKVSLIESFVSENVVFLPIEVADLPFEGDVVLSLSESEDFLLIRDTWTQFSYIIPLLEGEEFEEFEFPLISMSCVAVTKQVKESLPLTCFTQLTTQKDSLCIGENQVTAIGFRPGLQPWVNSFVLRDILDCYSHKVSLILDQKGNQLIMRWRNLSVVLCLAQTQQRYSDSSENLILSSDLWSPAKLSGKQEFPEDNLLELLDLEIQACAQLTLDFLDLTSPPFTKLARKLNKQAQELIQSIVGYPDTFDEVEATITDYFYAIETRCYCDEVSIPELQEELLYFRKVNRAIAQALTASLHDGQSLLFFQLELTQDFPPESE